MHSGKPNSARQLYIVLLVVCTSLICHQLSFAVDDIRFKRISIDRGLSQSTVETIIQDKYGFMWFGTEDGLNRYDGYEFRVFKHNPDDSASISNNNIWCLYEDSYGYLWVGTFNGGLNRFNYETEKFSHYLHHADSTNGISSNRIRSIVQDQNDILWIGTRGGGINALNLQNREFEEHIKDPDAVKTLSGAIIRHLFVAQNNNLWIATNIGLFIYNQTTGIFQDFDDMHQGAIRLSSKNIRHIYQDKDNYIWISTTDGLNRFDPTQNKISWYHHDPMNPKSISTNNFREVCEDSKGLLWIAGHRGGVILYDKSSQKFSTHRHDDFEPHSLSSNNLRRIYQDRSGLVWIGTLGGGLNIFDPGTSRFQHYRSDSDLAKALSHSIVWSVTQSSDGDLWFATHHGGLNQVKRSSGEVIVHKYDPEDPHSISSNNLRYVTEDRSGNMWIATQDKGINCLDRTQNRFIRYAHNTADTGSVSNNNVRMIYEDRYGNLWICTWGSGIDLYNPESHTFKHFKHQPENSNSLSGNNVISIFQDSKNAYWVATSQGLNKLIFPALSGNGRNFDFSRPEFTHFFHIAGDPSSLSNNYVLSIHESKTGELWIGTMLGLNRFRKPGNYKSGFRRYFIKDGLPNDIIYGILEDSKGFLWCSTNMGLSRFDPVSNLFKNYNVQDGLHGNEFNTGAFTKTFEGSMIFGGVDGASEFYPDSLFDNPYVAPVVITGFHIFDQPADFGRAVYSIPEITLSYQDNYFSFNFAALDFSKPERNKYAYRLDGLDKDWINAGTRRYAGYTKLDAGEYIFRVKGTNGDGVWNEQGTSVRIIITPPFWKTWWFVLSLVMAAGGGISFVIVNRVRQLLAIERLRSKIAADLHDDIGAGLTEISIMGEVITQKLPAGSKHAVNSELEGIANKARNLIDSMSHIVWMVNPKRDSLFELISRLSDTYKELLDSKNIQFKTDNLDTLKKVRLKMEHRQQLFMLFHEAINNSIKYSQGTQITLSSNLRGKQLSLKLEDNGQGFDTETVSAGNGLKNMRERARQIKGELQIDSQPNQGTTIEFEGKIL